MRIRHEIGLVVFLFSGALAAAACGQREPARSDVRVVRSAVTSTVDVHVIHPDGTPQPSVTVYAEDENGTLVASGTTDAQGHAAVTVEAGAYRFVTPGAGGIYLTSGEPGECVVPSC